jgi:hypothetical protein
MGKFTFDGLNWLLVQQRSSAPISLADRFDWGRFGCGVSGLPPNDNRALLATSKSTAETNETINSIYRKSSEIKIKYYWTSFAGSKPASANVPRS